jgi:hypothetical protein
MTFIDKWFVQYQKYLVWFADSIIGRWFFDFKSSDIGDRKLKEIYPDSIVWDNGDGTYSAEFLTKPLYAIRLYMALRPILWLIHQWDTLFANRYIPDLNLGMDVFETYSFENYPSSKSFDGTLLWQDSSWSAVRNSSIGVDIGFSGVILTASLLDTDTLDYLLVRGYMVFNTESIFGTNRNVKLGGYIRYAFNSFNEPTPTDSFGIFSWTPQVEGELNSQDFARIGSTPFAEYRDESSVDASVIDYLFYFQLNAAGLAYIDSRPIPAFSIRAKTDVDDVAPVDSTSSYVSLWSGQNEQSNEVAPRLVIQYLPVITEEIVKKRYLYKIFNKDGTYITTWSTDVISEPAFRTVINGGPGELAIRLARNYDDYGEDTDVKFQNRVECWCSDRDQPNGIKIFTGYISAYSPTLNGNEQYVDITVLGYVTEASRRIVRQGAAASSTTVSYASKDPSYIMRNLIDLARAYGGINLTYTATSIEDTGTTVSYDFKAYTLKEAMDKVIELCPEGWYYYVDPNGIVYLKRSRSDAPDINLTIGHEIAFMQAKKRIENMTNRIFVIGGGTTPLYKEYNRAGSQSSYGMFEKKLSDGRVTDASTADAMAGAALDRNDSPETRMILRIIDNNGQFPNRGSDIEQFQVGKTVRVQNLNYGVKGKSYWDRMQWDVDVWDAPLQFSIADILIIQSVTYSPLYAEIEASARLPEISKRIEDVKRNVDRTAEQDLPATPS